MNGREFLDLVLQQPSNAELVTHVERLVAERVPEDTWLDYKGGEWTKKVDTGDLRKDVTAFGNSDGGCLVIGVSETDRRATAFKTCEGDLDRAEKQVNAAITTLASQLWPPPREVRRVALSNGDEVFVLAVPRSARMVALPDNGTNAYYHRVADSTARTPDYLLSDLLFGRRQRPVLQLRHAPRGDTHSIEGAFVRLNFFFDVVNTGLTWANRLHAGMLGWSLEHPSWRVQAAHGAAGSVRWADSPPNTERVLIPHGFREGLAPMQTLLAGWSMFVPRWFSPSPLTVWQGAVYVGTDEGPPQWWSVRATLPVDSEPLRVEIDDVWTVPTVRFGLMTGEPPR